ncbi:MAG: MBL fold metallo-hydrolase [Syntrophomonadaceae bacterium]|jgi:7,8-dihydropterin-6-yl-methyl-4-(beta-D-ribofuranosyl)aminobenzene 5'-phosphate synthase
MKVKIKILVENTASSPRVKGEYGLAVLVNVDDYSVLLDTGCSNALLANAPAMGVDLEQIEDVVISHGHFDHTGGMLDLINKKGVKRVYAHPDAFLRRFLLLSNGRTKDIGSLFTPQQLADNGIDLILTPEFTEIFPQVFVTGQIPRLTDYEGTGINSKIEAQGELIDDNINDDMALVIKHPEGLIIISGCAHSGMINTINYARNQTGCDNVLAYIGGTHLMSAEKSRIIKTIDTLKTYNIKNIITGHCTGFNACAMMYSELGPAVIKGDAGMSIEF